MSLDKNYEKDLLFFFCILQKFQFYSIVISDKAHHQMIFPGFAFNITYDGLVTALQRWCCMQSCSIIVIGGVCLVITALFLACYGWRWLVEHFERQAAARNLFSTGISAKTGSWEGMEGAGIQYSHLLTLSQFKNQETGGRFCDIIKSPDHECLPVKHLNACLKL